MGKHIGLGVLIGPDFVDQYNGKTLCGLEVLFGPDLNKLTNTMGKCMMGLRSCLNQIWTS